MGKLLRLILWLLTGVKTVNISTTVGGGKLNYSMKNFCLFPNYLKEISPITVSMITI